jgi:hypothetical protein
VFVKGTSNGVTSDERGRFAIQVPAGQRLTLGFRRVAYKESSADVLALTAGARFVLDVTLAPTESNLEVTIRERRLDDGGMVREKNMKELRLLPSTTGNLESVLPHIALGTNMGTGGELSSQYQVRGGNYDENLVYVNDFEIYRPQLIRAGQQEGLTFANLDMVRDLSFSSGGFQAKYGDKLSSVLDIKYKRPDSLRASANASLLGGSAHIEGSITSKKHTYRTFRYLAVPKYPSGSSTAPPGPFSILNTPGINPTSGLNVGPPKPASAFNGTVLGYDSFNPGTNFRATTPAANQNGVVFFPGSTAVYTAARLQGGYGISGDGVDQDDIVTFFGSTGFAAPTYAQAGQFFVRGIRLPYIKFSRTAQIGV